MTRLKPDILVSGTLGGVIAFKRFTDSIPIVSPALIDPVGFGWAASHARPGGNVTGVLSTVEDLPGKQFALAAEMVPWCEQNWSTGQSRQPVASPSSPRVGGRGQDAWD
jgi:putative ABC transport system substrate-binding protein